MSKFLSILKAIMSQDMNIFKFKTNAKDSKLKKIMIPILLTLIIMVTFGVNYYIIAEQLAQFNLTYIMLTFALVIPTVLTLFEGIYKSQGILFETRDNDLLFSMPISKKTIVKARLTKMYIFQLLYNTLLILPAFIVYSFFEHPQIGFYLISLLMIILLPIIPTVIACCIGYLIKNVSVKFKAKKLMQTILTFVIFIGILGLSYNSNSWMQELINNATSINDIITKIYYPIGAYINLIQKFELIILIRLIGINIIILALGIWIISPTYFKTISKSKEYSKSSKNKIISFKQNSIFKALVIKELKKYFSSTVYVFNTLFGMVLLLIITIGLCINFDGAISMMTSGKISNAEISEIYSIAPKIFYAIVIMLSFMTSITSASISIEGKTFAISKSLPVKAKTVLASKIVSSNLICIPIILICDIICFIYFKVGWFDIISILLVSFMAPTSSALIGLLVNLKYPKMNATSDTEIIKQSISSVISVFAGMFIAIVLIGLLFSNSQTELLIGCELLALGIFIIVLWKILEKYGEKRYREIEI